MNPEKEQMLLALAVTLTKAHIARMIEDEDAESLRGIVIELAGEMAMFAALLQHFVDLDWPRLTKDLSVGKTAGLFALHRLASEQLAKLHGRIDGPNFEGGAEA